MNIARSRVTDEMRLSIGILGPRAETRRPSPNICPSAPTWPTASDANRSWSMRENETPPLQPVRVNRHAQVFTTCAAPPRAMIRASPHPSVEIFSRRFPGPTRQIKYASSAMPETAAMARRAFCLVVVGLDTAKPRLGRCSAELLHKDTLCVGQRLRRVDILPCSVLDIERAQPAFSSQHAHAV